VIINKSNLLRLVGRTFIYLWKVRIEIEEEEYVIFFNKLRQESLLPEFVIILTVLFWVSNIILLSVELPQNIIPYNEDMCTWSTVTPRESVSQGTVSLTFGENPTGYTARRY
jgi:hypothetical protein